MTLLDPQSLRNPPWPINIINRFFGFADRYSLVDQMIRGRDGEEADRTEIKINLTLIGINLITRINITVAQINLAVLIILVGWITFIILSIELIIPWNHISGAYSFDSGQWIVLVAAVCNFIRVLYKWQKLERMKPKDDPLRVEGLRNSLVDSRGFGYFKSGVSAAAGVVSSTVQVFQHTIVVVYQYGVHETIAFWLIVSRPLVWTRT